MSTSANLGSFIHENKKLLREYLDLRLEVYKLKLVKIVSKSAGYFIWTIVSLFLGFLFFTFVGLVIGFWMSSITGNYTQGFGIATLIMLGVITVVAIFRKFLFINPIIRTIIRRSYEEEEDREDYFSEN
jgi:hypothetical protein